MQVKRKTKSLNKYSKTQRISMSLYQIFQLKNNQDWKMKYNNRRIRVNQNILKIKKRKINNNLLNKPKKKIN